MSEKSLSICTVERIKCWDLLIDGLKAKLVPLTRICLYWLVMSSAIFLLAIKTHILLLDIREINLILDEVVVLLRHNLLFGFHPLFGFNYYILVLF